MASAEDDFTFPTTATAAADSQIPVIGSPPLWRHLAASRQNPELLSYKGVKIEEDQEYKANMTSTQGLKSSSILDPKDGIKFDDDQEEERMDMMWEDLNEEFSRKSGKISQNRDVSSSPGRPVEMSCIKAMKLSKANGIHGKKSNILVFIKIVKRAFAIHNSRSSMKKQGRYL